MSSTVWLVSDMHLHHRNLDRYRHSIGGPEDAAKHYAELFAEKVHKRDVVWILGDVGMTARAYETLASWPGIKRLVMGNHDQSRWFGDCFRSVHASLEHDGVLFTHFPVADSSVRPRYRVNVHGHTHAQGMGVASPGDPLHRINISPEAVHYDLLERDKVIALAKQLAPPWEKRRRSEDQADYDEAAAALAEHQASGGRTYTTEQVFGEEGD